MKIISMYECEICKDVYRTENEAVGCETTGREEKLLNEGDMVEYRIDVGGGFESFYVNYKVGKIEDRGHYYYYELLDEHEFEDGEKEWYEVSSLYGKRDIEEHLNMNGVVNQ